MRYLLKTSIILILSVISATQGVWACSAFMVKTKNEEVVAARTVDYHFNVEYRTKIHHKGEVIQSVIKPKEGQQPFSWKSIHRFVTVDTRTKNPKGVFVALDGMNDAGLSISVNLAHAQYPDNNASFKTLSTDDIVYYILSNAANIQEAENLFTHINIQSAWFYHYIIFDVKGNSLVVEFENYKVVFHRNKTSIMTNDHILISTLII